MPELEDVPALTGNQLLALVVLMAEARQLTNNELKELAGFTLTGTDKTKLNKLGLVESEKFGNMFSHELTEKGWAVVRSVRETPKGAGSAVRSMVAVLTNLDRALEGRYSHAMFFTRTPIPEEDLVEQIRLSYDKMATGEWVSLADIREQFPAVKRADLDAALRTLARQDDVRIIPAANSKALKVRDRKAALDIGGEANHSLAIGAA